MADSILTKKIESLQSVIMSWAIKNEIWEDSNFTSYFEYFNDEPSEDEACITVLLLGPLLNSVFSDYNNLTDKFEVLIEKMGFCHELYDSNTILFFCIDEELNKKYIEYFEWQWISELVKPDYTSLYQEVFSYFALKPEKFHSLTSRQFEVLIGEIFKNQGYRVELGKGTNDRGIDLKLFSKDDIDHIVTLVQVKRYKPTLPIRIDSVAYLSCIVDEYKANRGLFITTSKYLPQVKKFAERQETKLRLYDSDNVKELCEQVKTKIIRNKSDLVGNENILKILKKPNGLEGEIVVARVSRNTELNDFCMIIKDTPHVVLLMRLPKIAVKYHDEYRVSGEEIPVLDDSILSYKNEENVFRATKSFSSINNKIEFWGNKNLYSLWDKQPKYFYLFD